MGQYFIDMFSWWITLRTSNRSYYDTVYMFQANTQRRNSVVSKSLRRHYIAVTSLGRCMLIGLVFKGMYTFHIYSFKLYIQLSLFSKVVIIWERVANSVWHLFLKFRTWCRSDREVTFFLCETQLSTKFFLLINLKLQPTAFFFFFFFFFFLLNIAEHENLSAKKYEIANYCQHLYNNKQKKKNFTLPRGLLASRNIPI